MANKSRNNDVLITALVLSLGFGDLFLHGKTCINENESFFNFLGWILACANRFSNVSLKKLKLAKKTQRTNTIWQLYNGGGSRYSKYSPSYIGIEFLACILSLAVLNSKVLNNNI